MAAEPANGSAKPSSMVALTRLQKELVDLMSSGADGVCAFPDGDDMFRWVATIQGPSNSVYDGLEFRLALQFAMDYPFTPPHVVFTTPCYHPNISLKGDVCLDILRESWSAVLSVSTVLLSLQSLLLTPNNASPLNPAAAELWSKPGYREQVLHYFNGGTGSNAAPSATA